MKLAYVALCLIMGARSLMRYICGRAPSRLLGLLFWIVLLIYLLTGFWPLIVLLALLAGLVALARWYPLHAIALESRIAMLWSRGDARQVDQLFAEMPGLVKATKEEWHEKLKHKNPDIKMLAIHALGEAKDRTAVDKLVALLGDDATDYHVPALEALGMIGDPKAVSSVLRFLKHDEEHVREIALTCVRNLRSTAAIPAIVEQLRQEKKPALMKAGLQTLYHLGAKDALAAHWDTIPLQAKSAYFNSIYDITEERLDEMSCVASFAVQDAADEIRKEGRSLKRRILLHEDAKRYADIFPAKDVVKSAGLEKPQPITLRTDETLRFDVADGGYLEVHPGTFTVDLSAQYQHKAKDWDDTDVVDMGIQVSDYQGDVWETHFRVPASVVFDTVLGTSAQGYYHDIPEDYRQAFRDRMLLRGLQTLDDSRECKDILIGQESVEVFLKYQVPIMDLALHEDRENGFAHLLIRTFRVTDNQGAEIPPFVSAFGLMAFLLQTTESTHEDCRVGNDPLTGKHRVYKVGPGARRQPNVAYCRQ